MSAKKSFDLFQQLLTFISSEKLDALAKETGFIKRKRQITASDFLSLLFEIHGNVLTCSLQELCTKLSVTQNISVSRTAIDKKFTSEAVEFFTTVDSRTFLSSNSKLFFITRTSRKHFTFQYSYNRRYSYQCSLSFKATCTKNSTEICKIQFENDLLFGYFTYLNLDFKRVNDTRMGNERIPFIEEEELCMQDFGYFSIEQLRKIDEHDAYFISKIRNDAYLSLKNPNKLFVIWPILQSIYLIFLLLFQLNNLKFGNLIWK